MISFYLMAYESVYNMTSVSWSMPAAKFINYQESLQHIISLIIYFSSWDYRLLCQSTGIGVGWIE